MIIQGNDEGFVCIMKIMLKLASASYFTRVGVSVEALYQVHSGLHLSHKIAKSETSCIGGQLNPATFSFAAGYMA